MSNYNYSTTRQEFYHTTEDGTAWIINLCSERRFHLVSRNVSINGSAPTWYASIFLLGDGSLAHNDPWIERNNTSAKSNQAAKAIEQAAAALAEAFEGEAADHMEIVSEHVERQAWEMAQKGIQDKIDAAAAALAEAEAEMADFRLTVAVPPVPSDMVTEDQTEAIRTEERDALDSLNS